MNALLDVRDLRVSTGKPLRDLVRNVSFSLDAGQSAVVLGSCGSGKSTLCRSLLGLLPVRSFLQSGSIRFAGTDLLTMKAKARRRLAGDMAYIPQNAMTALNPALKIGRQMDETLSLRNGFGRAERRRRIEEALLAAGLDDPASICASYPFALSGGMLQRVTIAFALLSGARLIVADEPTTALDAIHRRGVIDVLKTLQADGIAVLMVTHDFPTALQLGGGLLVMRAGRIVEQGPIEKVMARPRHDYTKALIEASCLVRKESAC